MKRLIAILVLAGAAPAAAQTPRPETPEIATGGHGEVVLQPDYARLHLGIEVRGATAAAASSQIGARAQQARAAIQAKGFPLDSIRVSGFDVSPNYRFDPVRKLVDYVGRATVELTVRPVSRLAAVMDTALVSGINDIRGIDFRSDSLPAARDRALALALGKARRDAEALARAAGGRVGRLLTMTTEAASIPYERAQVGMMAMRAETSGAPPVEREVIVQVSVQAKWEYVPSP
jgi:uncharacterized protein YggE